MNFQWRIPAVDKQAIPLSKYRLLILVPLAAFLIWEVATRSLAAYFAETQPGLALQLRSTNSTALLSLVDQALKAGRYRASDASSGSKTGGSTEIPDTSSQSQQSSTEPGFYPSGLDAETEARVRSWAELALRNDPLNAEAFRVLGQLSDRTPDEERTRTLMQAAVRRSLRESVAVYWMMQKSFEKQDYHAAIRYADVLARTRPQFLNLAMPMLGQIAENKSANTELKQLLATNPPWRAQFFASLPGAITDARTPLDFLLSLRNSTTPPTAADFSGYVNFLIAHGFYDLAYYTWLQLLPPEQLTKAAHLFNGSFETEPSGLPFDWVFSQGTGSITKIATRPDGDGEHALFTQFGPGRVEFPGVTQLVVLSPGAYALHGKYKIDIVSERGLQWRITCASGQKSSLGESQPFNGTGPEWKDFDVSFTVPNTDCPAQYVQLFSGARSASEKFMSGSVWYGDLQIVRNETPTP